MTRIEICTSEKPGGGEERAYAARTGGRIDDGSLHSIDASKRRSA